MIEATIYHNHEYIAKLSFETLPQIGSMLKIGNRGFFQIDMIRYYFPLDHDNICHVYSISTQKISGDIVFDPDGMINE